MEFLGIFLGILGIFAHQKYLKIPQVLFPTPKWRAEEMRNEDNTSHGAATSMQTLIHAVTTKVCMTFYISPYDDR